MKIAVVGTGYVGLVAGVCFADSGHSVSCLDVDDSKIERLRAGECPIYEPGLEDLIRRNLDSGRLRFSSSYSEVITTEKPEVVFLAVGTPSTETGDADLRFVKKAVEQIVASQSAPVTLVTKSTVPVGTRMKILEWIGQSSKFPVRVASNPEFLREGCAVEDFLRPDRVVIGAVEPEAFAQLEAVYAPFVGENGVLLKMDPVSAEMTKYACNSFLATKVSFMNELSVLCEKMGADIDNIRQGMGLDPRIGKDFLFAGAGFGGSCFPKDLRALLSTARVQDVDLGIVNATEASNERQKRRLFEKIKKN
jgi:UDPglucose 6-dehydrogenase